MPELPEVESYRCLAQRVVGRPVRAVTVPDGHCLAAGTTAEVLSGALRGTVPLAVRRRGKLLLVDCGSAGALRCTFGMHFGMTGTLVVDGTPGVDRLIYGPERLRPEWFRFQVHLEDGGELSLHDPRRLGRVALDPPEGQLGPDALDLGLAELRRALVARPPGPAVKARLLDQTRIAGIGNLVADEVLWRSGISPERPCSGLHEPELRRLARTIPSTLHLLLRRGGSHTGDLMAHRRPGGRCPGDGTPLRRAQVGGRTTWWCPAHQR